MLVLKTNDCLRHLDRKLGTPINTASVVAQITADVILKEDLALAFSAKENRWFNVINSYASYSNVMLRVGGLMLVSISLELKKYIAIWRGFFKSFCKVMSYDKHVM